MKKLLIYLDNCCFNRPYDDQTHEKIYLETDAKLKIQERIKNKEINLVWSYMLDFENNANLDIIVKKAIIKWKKLSKIDIIETESLLIKAEEISQLGIDSKDSIHISCAIKANVDFFITTDYNLIKKGVKIKDIAIINPVSFFTDKA
jgi:predicted nucleic acid-binding protein